jgi:hypothetical protein
MAITSIADVWVPEIWIPAVTEKMATLPSIINSGIVQTSALFNQIASGAGTSANVPLWLDTSDQADAPQAEDTAPTPQKATTGVQIAPILNREWAGSSTALAAAVSGDDPAGELVGRLATRRLKQRQATLVSILAGLFDTNGGLNSLSDDNFDESGNDATAAQLIDTAMIINASAALGERESDLESGAMLVHPVILAALRIQDENNFERDSAGPFTITRWKGIPIFTSNALRRAGTTNGFVYSSFLIANGAFALGEKPQAGDSIDVASLQYEEDKAKNNWTIYDRTRFLLHPNFMKFAGTPAGQSCTNAELATAADWDLSASSADRCGMVRIRSNG